MAKRKDPAAVALGRKGGKAAAGAGVRAWRAKKTPEELSAIGRKAAAAKWLRWKNDISRHSPSPVGGSAL